MDPLPVRPLSPAIAEYLMLKPLADAPASPKAEHSAEALAFLAGSGQLHRNPLRPNDVHSSELKTLLLNNDEVAARFLHDKPTAPHDAAPSSDAIKSQDAMPQVTDQEQLSAVQPHVPLPNVQSQPPSQSSISPTPLPRVSWTSGRVLARPESLNV